MNLDEAQKKLADLLEPLIEVSSEPSQRRVLNMTDDADSYRPLAESMAKELLGEALARGISNMDVGATLLEVSGGAASDFVFRARSSISLIIKVQKDAKLKNEAIFLKSLQPGIPNATVWQSLFPRVLAEQVEKAPYAYAMEDFREEEGYKDLSKWIFQDKLLPEARIAQSKSLLHVVLEQLLNVYRSSKDTNSRINLYGEAYLGRIQSRMTEAEELYSGFKAAAIKADAKHFHSWRWYMEEILKRRTEVEATVPNFQTAVHGDSHPGNIMVRLVGLDGGEFRTEVRLIDPRGWYLGDYVFDLAKLSHYLLLTGPVERWGLGANCEYSMTANVLRVGPMPSIPSWLVDLERTIHKKAVAFGSSFEDKGAGARYSLAMASCYLGSVPVRWKNEERLLAMLMYAHGLKWLEQFKTDLQKSRSTE